MIDKSKLRESIEALDKGQVIDIVIQQVEKIEGLTEKINNLQKRIEELEREKHRSAAPFRIADKKKKEHPKRPGNKIGHKGHYRTIDEGKINETINVPLEGCPHCKGPVSEVNVIEQIIEEIPPPQKQVYKVITYCGECSKCGTVYSAHPLQTSTATGAAKVQIGPHAKALAMSLQYEYGMTKRKVCHLMEKVFDIPISPGGLVYTTHHTGKKMDAQYQNILKGLKQSDVVHSDETSWYVGNPKYWLWVFTNKQGTAYQVSNSRGRDVIKNMVGENYKGTLVSDCLVIYDDVNPLQHKCYSHHLKAISQAKEKAGDEQKQYLKELEQLLISAMAVKKVKPDKTPEEYERLCKNLEKRADELILPEREKDTADAKVANRLRKQRDHLFTFLYHEEVDATNNLAERQLRPAVIARKVSCGNKTETGAKTWQTLASISATANQNNQCFTNLVVAAIRLG